MSRGYPDYGMSPVLPFAKVFATQASLVATILAGRSEDLFSITGKGVIETGYAAIRTTVDHALVNLSLWIDGVRAHIPTLWGLRDYSSFDRSPWPFYLAFYDPDEPDYALGFYKETFFGVSFRFEIGNANAFDIDVVGEIAYAHI